MPWDITQLQRQFDTAQNKRVVQFLITEHPSAHSDCTDELFHASRHIKQRLSYCPNPQAYAYYFLHTHSNIIYALALGMKTVVFRLPTDAVEDALQKGGVPFEKISKEWISFVPFRNEEPLTITRNEMVQWCQKAFEYASRLSA